MARPEAFSIETALESQYRGVTDSSRAEFEAAAEFQGLGETVLPQWMCHRTGSSGACFSFLNPETAFLVEVQSFQITQNDLSNKYFFNNLFSVATAISA